MKRALFIIALIATSLAAVAQSNTIDKRLLVKYSAEELATLKADDPKGLELLNYCIENAWYLQSIPQEKVKANPGRIGSIKIKNLKKINFYALNIDIIKDDYQFFAIEGTEQMIVIKSLDHITKELNK